MSEALNAATAALFGDIDLEAAEEVLAELGLPMAYSNDAVNKINEAANTEAAKAADLKLAEAPKAERKAAKLAVDRYVNARGFLYRLRPASPGDVVVEAEMTSVAAEAQPADDNGGDE